MPRRRNRRQVRRRKVTKERESDDANEVDTQQDQQISEPVNDQEEEMAVDEDNRDSASSSSASDRVRSSNINSTALTPKIVATPRKRKSLVSPSAAATRPSATRTSSMITFSPNTRTPTTPAVSSSTAAPTLVQTLPLGSSKKGRKGFTPEEDAVILEVVQHCVPSGSNFIPKSVWNTCSSKLSHLRTPVTCKNRFYRYINKRLGSPYIDTSVPFRRSIGTGSSKRKRRRPVTSTHEEKEQLGLHSSEEESKPPPLPEEEEAEIFLPSSVSPGTPPSSPFGGDVGLLEFEEEEEESTRRSVAQERASKTQRDIEKDIDIEIKKELEMVSMEPRIMTAKKVRSTSRFIPDSENEDAELEERKIRRKKKREAEQAAEASKSKKRQSIEEPSRREEQARKKKQKLSSRQKEKQGLNTAQIESSEDEEEEQRSTEPSDSRSKRQTTGTTKFTREQIELVKRIADQTDKDAAVVLHALYVCSGDPDLATRYIQGEDIPVWTIEDDKILQSTSTSESAQKEKKKLIEERGYSQCNERIQFLGAIE